MTKQKILLITLLTTATLLGTLGLLASSAHAVDLPGWERPVREAKMKVLKSQSQVGIAVPLNLTMTQQKGMITPTGFLISIGGKETFLGVSEDRDDGCGSKIYYAEDMDRARILTLTDHSARICDDFKPYQWEGLLEDRKSAESVYLLGNPEVIITIQ